MKLEQTSSPDFSADSSLILSSTNKNQADRTLNNSTVLRYVIPEHLPKRIRPPFFLISATSPRRLRWDFFIMVLAVWNCFYVPFAMAFMGTEDTALLLPLNVLIDLMYICDVVVSARTAYIDLYTGEEVRDWRCILKHYFSSGKLVVDAISAVPFGVITWVTEESQGFQLLTLMKIARLLRLSKIIMFMRTKEQIKLKLKLTQIFFLFFTYLHVVACLWYLLLREDRQYIPPALYIDQKADLYESSVYRQYAYSLYMSVYMLTAAEIGPRTPWERIFAGIAIISGQLLQGFLFGQLTVTLLTIHKRGSKVGELQISASTTMVNMKLPRRLHHRIFSYIVSIQGFVTSREEIHSVIDLLPPSFIIEIHEFVFRSVIESNITLSPPGDVIESVLYRLGHRCPQPEDTLITQGEDSDCMYFTASGTYEVYVQDERRHTRKVRELKKGSKFGEIGLLYQTKRTASVVSAGFGILAVLKRADLDLLRWKFPQIWVGLERSALGYQDMWKTFMIKTILKCPYFASLSEEKLSEIVYLLPFQQLKPGEYLYKEGEKADKAVFILSGNIEIYLSVSDSKTADLIHPVPINAPTCPSVLSLYLRRGSVMVAPKLKAAQKEATKLVVEELGQGSALSCNLLLLKGKRQHSAKAVEASTVLVLSRKLLLQIGRKMPELEAAVEVYRQQLERSLGEWPFRRIQLVALDYEKCFPHGTRRPYVRFWNTRMKVKRCALGKLIEKRHLRHEGVSDIANLSRRLQAIMDAMAKKDLFLAEKLRRGFIPPTSEDIAKIFSLLQPVEVENPLVTQFASSAITVNRSLRQLAEGLMQLLARFKALEEDKRKQLQLLREIRKVTGLVSEISVYRR